MARPNKLSVAKHRVMRLQLMLRKEEEKLHVLETKEVQQEHYNAQQQYNRLAMRVEDCNKAQLQKEMGSVKVNQFNPFADLEDAAHVLALVQARLRWNGGV